MKNPYVSVMDKFNRKKVRFLIIGVFGINHYAPNPGLAFSTQDCDILVEPEKSNLLTALKILESEGYTLQAHDEPLGRLNPWLARRIIKHRASVSAIKRNAGQIDIITKAAGYSFLRFYQSKRVFRVGRVNVPVASLVHLIRSKKICGREKDLKFLQIYKARLGSMKVK